MNILPRSVVFVDDNPVERAAMTKAFPSVRVLGRHPYYLRRILLYSAETQVPLVTDESARRTEMIKAQFERESQRTQMSRQDFLREAAPGVRLFSIASTGHPRFARALELINKTNQFNTTAKRWKIEECEGFFRQGRFFAFEAADAFTDYGLVGVVIVEGDLIVQWVMSCRVLGYQIEDAIMATLVGVMRDGGASEIVGTLTMTDVNFPCRDLFGRCGFDQDSGNGDYWVLAADNVIAIPEHVTVSYEPAEALV
jgi:FkbH-like protein